MDIVMVVWKESGGVYWNSRTSSNPTVLMQTIFSLPGLMRKQTITAIAVIGRVTCDHTIGHVTELSLNSIKDVYYVDDTIWLDSQ
ncbi:unnamed protein product [Camellia sinensis]